MDKRIEKTKEALRKSLMQLAEEKPIGEISVSELCKAAGVNRTTFYKYYNLPQDVIEEYLSEFLESQIESFADRAKTESPEELTKEFEKTLRKVKDQGPEFRLYVQTGSMHGDFTEKFLAALKPRKKDLTHYYFLAGGMLSLVVYWIESDFAMSPQAMAKVMYRELSGEKNHF